MTNGQDAYHAAITLAGDAITSGTSPTLEEFVTNDLAHLKLSGAEALRAIALLAFEVQHQRRQNEAATGRDAIQTLDAISYQLESFRDRERNRPVAT
jgi:hypothetical protein